MEASLAALGDWLVGARLLTKAQLDALAAEVGAEGLELAAAAIQRRIIAEEAVVSLLSERFALAPAPPRLHRRGVPAAVLRVIPEDLCWQHRIFPFGVDRAAGRLQVAICDPTDHEARSALRELAGQDPELHIIGPRQLEKAIRKHYMDSWVDETRGKRRFFGYDELTDPGMEPKRGAAETEGQVAGPAPARSAAVRPPRTPAAGGVVIGRIGPSAPTGPAAADVRRAMAVAPVAANGDEQPPLLRRVAKLEQAVSELLRIVEAIGGERVAEAVARIRSALQG